MEKNGLTGFLLDDMKESPSERTGFVIRQLKRLEARLSAIQ